MKRRNIFIALAVLLLLWVVVFFAADFAIRQMDSDPEIIALPTETQRPIRTDVPLLVASPEPSETADAEETEEPTEEVSEEITEEPEPTTRPTAAFTLSPLEIQRFESNPVEVEALVNPQATLDLPRDENGGAYPIRIAIEDLGIISAVVAVQTDPNFDIVTPRETVGYYAATPKIGAGGNSIFVGHVYPGRVFNKLLDAEEGMIVRITDEYYEEHYYQISEIIRFPYEIGKAEDRETGFKYMYDDTEERITLVTCYPEYEWTHRFVVRAVPIDPPEDDTANRSSETGR